MMDQTQPLNEVALRRPGFHEGIRVTLGDGQSWALPEFRFRLFPRRDADGRVISDGRITYGPERDRDVGLALGESESAPGERLDAMIRLAGELFSANYELTNDMLATLLPYDGRDERLNAMWRDLVTAVQGREVPKASPVG